MSINISKEIQLFQVIKRGEKSPATGCAIEAIEIE